MDRALRKVPAQHAQDGQRHDDIAQGRWFKNQDLQGGSAGFLPPRRDELPGFPARRPVGDALRAVRIMEVGWSSFDEPSIVRVRWGERTREPLFVGLYNVRLAGTLAPPSNPRFMIPTRVENDVTAFP